MLKAIIAITTYNLEKYISEALDSVLRQKTDFDYKVLIADDCSTDGTVDILRKYKEKYPEKIKLMLSEKNVGSLANSNRLFDKIDCEYFSFLDGDDYWLGEDRLQKHVDFLDKNREYSMCAGNTRMLRDGKEAELLVQPRYLNKPYSFDDYLSNAMPFIHTSGITVRNTIYKNGLPECYFRCVDTFENCALRGEDFRRILHLEQGSLFLFDDIVSVYRIHDGGLWQGSSEVKRLIEGAIAGNFYSKYFNGKYDGAFDIIAQTNYKNLIAYLLTNCEFANRYLLSEKDTALLTSLMTDISKRNAEKTPCVSCGRLKKKVIKLMLSHTVSKRGKNDEE